MAKDLIKIGSSEWKADVNEFKRLAIDTDKNIWAMAEIAANVTIKYGRRSVAQFAQDVGRAPRTIQAYKVVIERWPEIRGRPRNLEIASVLSRLIIGTEKSTGPKSIAKRYELVAKNPGMTKEEARAIMKEWRDKTKPVLDAEDCLIEAKGRFNLFFNGHTQLDELIEAAWENKNEIQDHYIRDFHQAVDDLIKRLNKARERFKLKSKLNIVQLKEIEHGR